MASQGKPKVLILGTGGVGMIAALNLEEVSRSAETVCLVRSNYEKAISDGYKIESVNYGNFDNWRPSHIVRDLSEAVQYGPYEFVFVSTKNVPDGPHPVSQIIREEVITPGFTSIILAQNGIDIETEIYDKYPTNPVLSGVTLIGSTNTNGSVKQSGFDNLSIGCFFNDKIDPEFHKEQAQKFIEMYSNDKNDITYDADVRMTRWKKLCYNAAVNTCTAIVGLDVDRATMANTKETVMRPLIKEIYLIAKLDGYDIPANVENLMINISDGLFYSPSMLMDVRRNQLMELETIVGNPVKIAAKYGLQVPHLTLLYNLLHLIQFRIKEANGLIKVEEKKSVRSKEEYGSGFI